MESKIAVIELNETLISMLESHRNKRIEFQKSMGYKFKYPDFEKSDYNQLIVDFILWYGFQNEKTD